jgi:glutathione synthase/RimK-type ligase-like ATP-grasp enzyme
VNVLAVVGMLHHRKNPEKVRKAYALAAVAKMEGVEFFYFSYSHVDFGRKKINGWVYGNGSWMQKEVDFPPVVINSSGPKNQRQSDILRKLKKIVKITSYPVGNKMKVYKKIIKGGEFASHLIPSFKLKEINNIEELLKDHPKLVMKPYSGHHGENIYFIEKIDGRYKVQDGEKITIFAQNEMVNWLKIKLENGNYLIQPYINCKTRMGLSYDFRIHVQKNGTGIWEVNLIYPRISGSKLVSNISNGGYRGELVSFLKEEFGDKHDQVKTLLESFAQSFLPHFDSLYPHSFDELGIDVGIDDNLNLWIFEVNWRPGANHREFEVAKRLIPYCKYLQNG